MNAANAVADGVIVGIWTAIFAAAAAFYALNRGYSRTTRLLLAILALVALLNVVENIYFGCYFGAKVGVLAAAIGDYLGNPSRLIVPKLCNITAGAIVLGLLVLRWRPAVIEERTEADRKTAALRELAAIDHMTGLRNRRDFMAHAEEEWLRRVRYGRDLSLLILDIDSFKSINDRFGHHTGDAVIIGIAKLCVHAKRHADVAGRLGGEEFGILLPETSVGGAALFAERLRLLIAREGPRLPDPARPPTVSIGVSSAERAASLQEFLKQADDALYQAKHAGRNVVRCYA